MRKKLNRKGSMPLYAQIRDSIIAEIESGLLQPGDSFPTLMDLAKAHDVSMITSRRVLSDLVSEGYLEVARGMRTRVSSRRKRELLSVPDLKKHIGIFFRSIAGEVQIDTNKSPWTSVIFAGMQESIRTGHSLTLMPVGKEDNLRDMIVGNADNFDGFIFFPLHLGVDLLPLIEEANRPYVMISRWSGEITHNYIAADYYHGSMEVADYLIDQGLRSFLLLMFPDYDYSHMEQIRGFQEGLMKRGVSLSRLDIRESESIYKDAGYKALKSYWEEKGCLPEAIFTAGDYLAMGAIEFCREIGRAVPEDISIVGSTGTGKEESFKPTLSVLKVPMTEMGKSAMRKLVRMMENDNHRQPGEEIPMRFIRRESVRHAGVKADEAAVMDIACK